MPRVKQITEQELFPITESLLKKLAGSSTFIKGKDYYKAGAVTEIDIKGTKIIGEVQGGELYNITLNHNAQSLSGACDCPASEGIDFCKHCVAVALVRANQLVSEQEIKNKPAKKLSEPEKRRARLREYFSDLTQESLIEALVEIIDSDKALRQQWQLKAQQSQLLSATEIRKIITSSTPLNKHLYRSAEVRQYFSRIDELVDFLVQKLNPAENESLAIIEFTFDRIAKALGTIDDSGGYRCDSLQKLNELYLKILQQKQMSPQVLAEYVFNLWDTTYCDLLPSIPNDFDHLFDKEAKFIFLELVKKEWESQAATKRDQFGFGPYDYRRSTLQSLLLDEAYAQNDIDAIIAIKSKYANCAKDYLNISHVCFELKQYAVAREWLEKARAVKNKSYLPFGALERTEVNILLQENDPQTAIDVLWSLYQKTPELECLDAILDISKKIKSEKNWLDEAEQFHRQVLTKPLHTQEQLTHVNALISLLLQQQKPAEALAICQAYKTEGNLLLKVADCYKMEPEKSIPLVRRIINLLLQQPNVDNRSYQKVVELMQCIKKYATNGKKPELFMHVLHDIRINYKIKRNLMAYIQQAFGE